MELEATGRLVAFVVIAALLLVGGCVTAGVIIAEGNRHKNEKMWEDCVQAHAPAECEVALRLAK
jgi:hypothetical protein